MKVELRSFRPEARKCLPSSDAAQDEAIEAQNLKIEVLVSRIRPGNMLADTLIEDCAVVVHHGFRGECDGKQNLQEAFRLTLLGGEHTKKNPIQCWDN